MKKVKTVYIGGGTPSISIEILKEINDILSSCISLDSVKEYTIESNPINISSDFCDYVKKIKNIRISLGIQSFNDDILKICNRDNKQSLKIVYDSLKLLEIYKFNTSIDLIIGLPDLNLENIEKEIKELNNILSHFKNITHISIYELSIEEGSEFYKKNIKLPNEKYVLTYEKELKKTLKKFCFKRYEVSNYCKNNRFSFHNLNYWKYKNYIGLGPSAHSTIDYTRIENKPDFDTYISGDFLAYKKKYKLSKKEAIEEYLLMGLRLTRGISFNNFLRRFDVSFKELFKNKLDKLLQQKLISLNNNRVKVTSKGFMVLNRILVDLFEEL